MDVYIGAQVRKRREALKLGQANLAKAIGISKQQVQKYEAGKSRISAASLFGICKYLNVSLLSMFENDSIRSRPAGL